MHMIFIRSNFKELNVIALGYFQTHFFQHPIYRFIHYRTPILRRTYKMIDLSRYIMTVSDYITHALILSRRRAAG